MSPALNYRPAYLGLFAAQVLAIACNAFLDIQYGIFAAEVLIWSVALAFSLRTGWKQHGLISEHGNKIMKRYMIFGAIVSVVIFIPMWGFPRAGIYMLAALQVSYNCITTTRRQLHMGLLMSLVMVIFAATHYRADWTMLFYLVPYVIAVVFTLVAEQINRKADDLQQQSLDKQVVGGQMTAIASATAAILSLGLLLYVVTPQVTSISLMWKWGNPTNLVLVGDKANVGNGDANPAKSGSDDGSGSGKIPSDSGQSQVGGAGSSWPSSQEMRQAASRKGMPEWQRSAIRQIADGTDWASVTFKPVMQYLSDLWQAFKKWLHENWQQVITTLIILCLLALLYAQWLLMREAKIVTWIHTRFDYLLLVIFYPYGEPSQAAKNYYEAMGRLFELQDIQRSSVRNSREYQAEIDFFFKELRKEIAELTLSFEDVRYGQRQISKQQILQMKEKYKKIFKTLDD